MLLSGRLVHYSHNRTFVFHQACALIIDFRKKNGNQFTACSMPCTLFSNQTIVLLSTLYQALYMVYDLFLIQAYIDKLVSKDLRITTKHVIR